MLTLRDVEGLSAEEVSDLLDLTPGNQRVILHRARAKVRAELEDCVRRDRVTAARYGQSIWASGTPCARA